MKLTEEAKVLLIYDITPRAVHENSSHRADSACNNNKASAGRSMTRL